MAQVSAQKKGYKLPRPLLTNSDLTRLINSDEIQSIVKEPKVTPPLLVSLPCRWRNYLLSEGSGFRELTCSQSLHTAVLQQT